ncbi:TraV family lipoprotein [Psychromonas sp. KJ10-2]|uniref:TraV family lipoprotein n=1 Tax=Psychromonas sp. KJ10-2 TaxID=3391822 RepID=UPI0039B6A135
MRIWIAPWTDKSDDLYLSSLIYTDIENRKWNILNVSEKNSKSFVKPHLGNVESDVKTNGEVNLNGMEVRDKEIIERRFESLPKRQP